MTQVKGWHVLSTAAGAIFFLVVLILNDSVLKSVTGIGVSELQGASNPDDFRRMYGAWLAYGAGAVGRAGFSLGWDYAFMLLYGVFFIAAVKWATSDWTQFRPAITVVIIAMVAGTILDGAENILQLKMLFDGVDDATANTLPPLTLVKWVLCTPCMVLALVALAAKGVARLRR